MGLTTNGDLSPGPRREYTIHLSSIDHCMPRAYIRVCLAFRLPHPHALKPALAGLERFLRGVIRNAPYLAGYVDPAPSGDGAVGRVQILFSPGDVDDFPTLQVRPFSPDERSWTYDELDEAGLPPSVIRPELVSALPENTDDGRAPAFRVQANVVEGGLIVSIYLHHCVSDGTGLGLLVSGGLGHPTHPPDAVDCHHRSGPSDNPVANGGPPDGHLGATAAGESLLRTRLCDSAGFDATRHLKHRDPTVPRRGSISAPIKPGRGCVFALSLPKLDCLKSLLQTFIPEPPAPAMPVNGEAGLEPEHGYMTDHDVLHALLWHHCARARIPSLSPANRTASASLLIPVNIRARVEPHLPETYFGSAVDFARATQPLPRLAQGTPANLAALALAVRRAVSAVQDPYVRSAISISNTPGLDVRDLLAANMDRVSGADMYITSWLHLPLYTRGDLGMGLGMPDWVRKPWSRDPGACIILPQDPRKQTVEIVVQLADPDMARLLKDADFMEFVERVIE